MTADTDTPLTYDDTESLPDRAADHEGGAPAVPAAAAPVPSPEEAAVTADSDAPPTDAGESEGPADRVADRLERDRPVAAAAAALGRSPLMGHWTEHIATLESDLDAESAAEKTMLDAVQRDMAARPPAEAAGVDISAVKAADPGFDDRRFLSACRETLELVRKARAVRDPRFADGLLSAPLAAELSSAVTADSASGRHHVEPELEIASCAITGASVENGVPTASVRFHLTGEELHRDTAMRVIAGTTAETAWDEEWTFQRIAADGSDAV
ncbi:MAG: TIM44-like domain-containing protein, partial [Candidatus Dormibacteraeota bacterium]|nr:TIM44-like domain-containing protein [Candidatus Dormibacteraeota bacterium]